jgi:plasmid maintenance system antidote protein VapI
MSKKHLGSGIDDFLKQEGIFDEAQVQAVKEVVAWQLARAMRKKRISKTRMAALLRTSRSQVDRLLDPKNDITLSSLQRAAAMVGRRVSIELVRLKAHKDLADLAGTVRFHRDYNHKKLRKTRGWEKAPPSAKSRRRGGATPREVMGAKRAGHPPA